MSHTSPHTGAADIDPLLSFENALGATKHTELPDEDGLLARLLAPITHVATSYCVSAKRKYADAYTDCLAKTSQLFEDRVCALKNSNQELTRRLDVAERRVVEVQEISRASINDLNVKLEDYSREAASLNELLKTANDLVKERDETIVGVLSELDTALDKAASFKDQRDNFQKVIDQNRWHWTEWPRKFLH
jgi:small-conductance mechanosensitive channel